MKANSQCGKCEEWGHWHDDPECKFNKGKFKSNSTVPVRPQPRTQPQPRGYVAFTNDAAGPPKQGFVVDGRGPKKGKAMMDDACSMEEMQGL